MEAAAVTLAKLVQGVGVTLQRAGSSLSTTTLKMASHEAVPALVVSSKNFVASNSYSKNAQIDEGASLWYASSVVDSKIGRDTAVLDGALVHNSTVGANCSVGANAVLIGCSLEDGVSVPPGARLVDAKLSFENALIEDVSELALMHKEEVEKTYLELIDDEYLAWDKERRSDDYRPFEDEHTQDYLGVVPGRIMNSTISGVPPTEDAHKSTYP